MSNLSDRVSYLRGLAEGLKVDAESNEGKLIMQLIEVLQDAALEIDELHEAFDELNDYVESIDDDLSELEGDWDEDDDEFDGGDDGEDGDGDEDDDDDDDDETDFFPTLTGVDDEESVGMYVGCICPKCHGMFCVDAYEDDQNQMYVCPHCNESVEARPMDNNNVPIAKAFSEEPEDD